MTDQRKRCEECRLFVPPEPATKSGACKINGYRVGPGNVCESFEVNAVEKSDDKTSVPKKEITSTKTLQA